MRRFPTMRTRRDWRPCRWWTPRRTRNRLELVCVPRGPERDFRSPLPVPAGTDGRCSNPLRSGLGSIVVVVVDAPLTHIREEGSQRVEVPLRKGIELVVVTFGAAHGGPSHVMATVRTRSAWYFARYSRGWAPPSRVTMLSRLKPVAMRAAVSAPGIRSPASCSRVNWSKACSR